MDTSSSPAENSMDGSLGPSSVPMSYEQKLFQVFISCDTSGSGRLGNDDLTALCRDKLQLDDEETFFIREQLVLNGSGTQVDFLEFKEVFLNLLTRRAPANCSDSWVDAAQSLKLPSTASAVDGGDELGSSSSEKYFSMACVDHQWAEDYLRDTLNKLRVGEDGHLDREELQRVCESIGMTGIGDEAIDQLFEKLDIDKDGRVSFNDLVLGMRHQEEQARLHCMMG